LKKSLSIFALIAALAGVVLYSAGGFRASAQTEPNDLFRIGEKLTYNISFGRFPNVAYAETHVVSRGKIGGKEAVEIQSKMKTLNYMSLDFLPVDTQRTTLVSPADGSPIYVKNIDNGAGVPVETATNFATKGGNGFDLTTILYKIRASGGSGSFNLFENEKFYPVVFQTIGSEMVKSEAGDFPANIIDVKSDYLTEQDFTSVKISIASEGSNIPVLFRLKTTKGEFRGVIASIQVAKPEVAPTAMPLPEQTPRPSPKPTPTETPYVDNQPMNGLPFALGETLNYSVTSGARKVGTVTLAAPERKLVKGKDSLLLTATVTSVSGPEIFRVTNGLRTNIDPDTLAPHDFSVRFDGQLAGFNQDVRFDQTASKVVAGNLNRIDVPVGTHNVLSLLYAMRLFNLTPSKDLNNPVNDTRVAVFWQGRATVFTLRPAQPQTLAIGEQKYAAQEITVSAGEPQLNALGLKVWLSSDASRIPLRINIGAYQLDLILPGVQ